MTSFRKASDHSVFSLTATKPSLYTMKSETEKCCPSCWKEPIPKWSPFFDISSRVEIFGTIEKPYLVAICSTIETLLDPEDGANSSRGKSHVERPMSKLMTFIR